ncbi:hypothetical protein AC578_2925 [Pseudocercospora eumusae]|uniref:Glycosyl hydrolase family 43 protein n=1 Tax=Pseudocercospora eumusae TaxID=321146 RepID=A0A139HEH3_9PEZI|nr:hypothetical protein AC578_2925 [Pseudocercospora eumusae]
MDQISALTPSTHQPRLSFFQRHFTKPVAPSADPEKTRSAGDRRFSFASKGFLISIAAIVLMLFGIVAAAVVLIIGRNRAHRADGFPLLQAKPVRLAIEGNFPDPALYYENGTWYAVATNNAAGVLSLPGANATMNTVAFGQANVQMATSKDFVNWTLVDLAHQPLPETGAWAQRRAKHPANEPNPLSSTWAPALIKRNDGRYVMYYAATWTGEYPYERINGQWTHPQPHCVGAAVSHGFNPAGPYDPLAEPLACPIKEGGAIDPEAIRDIDGSLWVTWKVDGNNIGPGGSCGNTFTPQAPTPIMIQKMEPDGVTPVKNTLAQILDRTEADGPLVEAPALVRTHQGKYFLFFSSGCTRSPTYSVNYAVANNITGPYVRANETLLKTGTFGLEAPGSVGIAADGAGGYRMAFHARSPNERIGRVRKMYTTTLLFSGDTVQLVFPKEWKAHGDKKHS